LQVALVEKKETGDRKNQDDEKRNEHAREAICHVVPCEERELVLPLEDHQSLKQQKRVEAGKEEAADYTDREHQLEGYDPVSDEQIKVQKDSVSEEAGLLRVKIAHEHMLVVQDALAVDGVEQEQQH